MFLSDPTGLLTAVHKDFLRVLNCRELLFNDCGDRVAQLLHVELATTPFTQCRNSNDLRQEILIVNTHLLFPHDSSLCLVRLNQVSSFSIQLSFFFSFFFFMPIFVVYRPFIMYFTLLCLIIGLQNPAMCRILSEGKQSKPHVYNTLRVTILSPSFSNPFVFLHVLHFVCFYFYLFFFAGVELY